MMGVAKLKPVTVTSGLAKAEAATVKVVNGCEMVRLASELPLRYSKCDA